MASHFYNTKYLYCDFRKLSVVSISIWDKEKLNNLRKFSILRTSAFCLWPPLPPTSALVRFWLTPPPPLRCGRPIWMALFWFRRVLGWVFQSSTSRKGHSRFPDSKGMLSSKMESNTSSSVRYHVCRRVVREQSRWRKRYSRALTCNLYSSRSFQVREQAEN